MDTTVAVVAILICYCCTDVPVIFPCRGLLVMGNAMVELRSSSSSSSSSSGSSGGSGSIW